VRQAVAEARLKAEIEVFTSDPVFWLRNGPGKDAPGNPGWSAPVKPVSISTTNQQVNFLLSPQRMTLASLILETLAPFPGWSLRQPPASRHYRPQRHPSSFPSSGWEPFGRPGQKRALPEVVGSQAVRTAIGHPSGASTCRGGL
jgi:hypothetical protein